MFQAKVREDYKLGRVVAFGGHEYLKGKWLNVPQELEHEMKHHKDLLAFRELNGARVVSPPSDEVQSFEDMNMDELREYLDEQGIEHNTRMRKDELIELAQGAGEVVDIPEPSKQGDEPPEVKVIE